MDENIKNVVISIIIGFIDFTILYYLCLSLIDKKPKKIYLKSIFITFFYALIIGTMDNLIDSYSYRVITTLVALSTIKILSNKRIHDILLIYAIIFLCASSIQISILLLVNNLDWDVPYIFLLVQMLSFIIIIILYIKVPFSQLLNRIQNEILIKLVLFNLATIILVTHFYVNFEYTNSYLLYCFIIICVTLIGLCQTFKNVLFYTNDIPEKVHDTKNILISLQEAAYSISSIEDIRLEIKTAVDMLGIDTFIDDIKIGEYNKNILSIINKMRRDGAKFVSDIKYTEPNSNVRSSAVGYMLRVLLDNAIETGTKKPILIKININQDVLIISVANQYKKRSYDDYNKMFKKNYSTKGKGGRGYGLFNLSKFVRKHNGEIMVDYQFNEKQKCNYLIFTIDMGNFKLYSLKWINELL